MDIYCPRCAEPWEIDTFHDVAEEQEITFTEAVRNFKAKGCTAIGWGTAHCKPVDNDRAVAMSAVMELMGDDVDGMASMMEDFEAVGMI